MAINLVEHEWPQKLVRSGQADFFPMTVGKNLKIETSPGGEELLNETCPAGKAWSVRIIVEIEETDAV